MMHPARLLLLAALLLSCLTRAEAQSVDNRSSYKSITSAWDSAYTLTDYRPVQVRVTNLSTADTMLYFFGASKADSSTSAVYRVLPGEEVNIYVPEEYSGVSFKALFRRSKAAAIVSEFEQWPGILY